MKVGRVAVKSFRVEQKRQADGFVVHLAAGDAVGSNWSGQMSIKPTTQSADEAPPTGINGRGL